MTAEQGKTYPLTAIEAYYQGRFVEVNHRILGFPRDPEVERLIKGYEDKEMDLFGVEVAINVGMILGGRLIVEDHGWIVKNDRGPEFVLIVWSRLSERGDRPDGEYIALYMHPRDETALNPNTRIYRIETHR